jgi:ribosomal protein L17
MLRTMVSQLIEHGRIETTLPKAKELRRVADRCVTWGKEVRASRRQSMLAKFLFAIPADGTVDSENKPPFFSLILHYRVQSTLEDKLQQ